MKYKLIWVESDGTIHGFLPGTMRECFALLPRIIQSESREADAKEKLQDDKVYHSSHGSMMLARID